MVSCSDMGRRLLVVVWACYEVWQWLRTLGGSIEGLTFGWCPFLLGFFRYGCAKKAAAGCWLLLMGGE